MAIHALHNTLGAAYLGNIFAACFYGLTTLQTYIYYNRSAKDPTVLKTLVAMLWILDTLHLALVSHTVYQYSVTHFGNLLAILKPTWSVLGQVFATGLSDVIVRGIFCYRIWMLSKQRILIPAVLASSALLAFGCCLAFPIVGYTTYVELEQISWIYYLGLSTVLFSDILVSAALCTLLAEGRSNFRRADGVVRSLIMYSINTSLLTTTCALAALVAYAASPHTFIHIAFYFLLPKLLLNSLLATLNARESLRDQISRDGVQIPLSSGTESRNARTFDAERLTHYPAYPMNASLHDCKGIPVAQSF